MNDDYLSVSDAINIMKYASEDTFAELVLPDGWFLSSGTFQFMRYSEIFSDNKTHPKHGYVYCSYCGSKHSAIDLECRNCGAPL